MDLGGVTLGDTWLATVSDEATRRSFAERDAPDDHWEQLAVPGHWRSCPAFADVDGPVLYRRRFAAAAPDPGRRSWLVFDGIFYQGDVWLDGGYLGDTEGYFVPHAFEVTGHLRESAEHVVAVEVACTPAPDPSAKRNITGVFEHWDCLDPAWNPGGIWRPVRLEETGPVRIARLAARCTEATSERAVVRLRAEIDAATAATTTLTTRLDDVEHHQDVPLAAGPNHVEWAVEVADPRLWWPRVLGEQALHGLRVVVTDETGETSHERSLRIGLRQVELRNWVCRVNGERLHLKGANLAPTRMDLAAAPAEEVAADVALAAAAGLDLVRVHAHVGRPELYAAADEAGMLVWQDFPLQWGYARGIRKQAVRQATVMVEMLGHHPSIAIWCGHNEPMSITDTQVPTEVGALARVAARIAAHQQLPTWNKTVLDGSIARAIDRADGTRPVIPHSGVWPHLPRLDGTDTHVYFGWYHGQATDFPRFCRAIPRMARFVTEFGAQAVPDTADFMEPDRWPDLDWEHLGARHSLQKTLFDRHVPPADHESFADWREATQRYQAEVIRLHVETLRRLKYRPNGGFCQFVLNDCFPSVTWSVLGHDRRPKAGYDALAAACRPVIVVADWLPATVTAGAALAIDVHVVSDLRRPLAAARCTARLEWAGGEETWRWEGEVPPDECVRVGTVQAMAPEAPGELVLDLTLDTGDEVVGNRYTAVVVSGDG